MLTAFREAIQWLEERENFEQVKEWFDSTSRCTDFTLTSVLYLPSSCYLSFLFYLLPHLCSLFPILLLPLFPILPVTSPLFSVTLPPVTSLSYFTCYLTSCSLSPFLLLSLFPILPVTSPLFSVTLPPVTSLSYFTCYLTSVLYLPSSCYLSFLVYLLPHLCSPSPFLLLPLFPILPVTSPLFSISLPPVTSLSYFTCYLTSVLYFPFSCYLSFLFYLLPHLCSLSPFLLLPLFPILPVTSPLFSVTLPPVTSLSYFTCYLTSVLYLTSSCYFSSYFTCTSLAYFTCYLSFLFYLLLLFPILPVSSLSCFTGVPILRHISFLGAGICVSCDKFESVAFHHQ